MLAWWFYGGHRMPGINTAAGLEWLTRGSYGAKFEGPPREVLEAVGLVAPDS